VSNQNRSRELAVDVLVDDRIPALREVVEALVAHTGIVQRQCAGQDHAVGVAVLPQPVNHLGQQLQHATGALEVAERGPVLVEPVEDLRVDRVRLLHALEVVVLLGLRRQFAAVGAVQLGEVAAGVFHRQVVVDALKQPPAHDAEGLIFGRGLPDRVQAAEITFELGQHHLTASLSGVVGIWQRGQQDRPRHRLDTFG